MAALKRSPLQLQVPSAATCSHPEPSIPSLTCHLSAGTCRSRLSTLTATSTSTETSTETLTAPLTASASACRHPCWTVTPATSSSSGSGSGRATTPESGTATCPSPTPPRPPASPRSPPPRPLQHRRCAPCHPLPLRLLPVARLYLHRHHHLRLRHRRRPHAPPRLHRHRHRRRPPRPLRPHPLRRRTPPPRRSSHQSRRRSRRTALGHLQYTTAHSPDEDGVVKPMPKSHGCLPAMPQPINGQPPTSGRIYSASWRPHLYVLPTFVPTFHAALIRRRRPRPVGRLTAQGPGAGSPHAASRRAVSTHRRCTIQALPILAALAPALLLVLLLSPSLSVAVRSSTATASASTTIGFHLHGLVGCTRRMPAEGSCYSIGDISRCWRPPVSHAGERQQ